MDDGERDSGRDAERDVGRDAGRDIDRDIDRDAARDIARDVERDVGRDVDRDVQRDVNRDATHDDAIIQFANALGLLAETQVGFGALLDNMIAAEIARADVEAKRLVAEKERHAAEAKRNKRFLTMIAAQGASLVVLILFLIAAPFLYGAVLDIREGNRAVKECTTESTKDSTHECYERNQAGTGKAVASINVVTILANVCSVEALTTGVPVDVCVAERFPAAYEEALASAPPSPTTTPGER